MVLSLIIRRGPSAAEGVPILATTDPDIIRTVGRMIALKLAPDFGGKHDGALGDRHGSDDR